MAFIIELTSLIKMDLTSLFKRSFKKQPSEPLSESYLRPIERKQVTMAAVARVTAMLHRTEEEEEAESPVGSLAASSSTSHLREG